MSNDRFVILGAASAIAERYARILAGRGAHLLLVGRDGARLDAIAADLKTRGAKTAAVLATDLALPPEQQAALWPQMAERLGGPVDGVVLAYGILGDQKTAEADAEKAGQEIAVNFTSAVGWLTIAAAEMDKRNFGSIVAIGSVAGDRGRQSNYVYGAAKAGLGAFVQGLAHRMAGRPIRVLLVKPGFVDTPMTAGIKKGGPLWASPEKVAADIDKALSKGRTTLYTPWFWWPIMQIIKNLPGFVFNKLRI